MSDPERLAESRHRTLVEISSVEETPVLAQANLAAESPEEVQLTDFETIPPNSPEEDWIL